LYQLEDIFSDSRGCLGKNPLKLEDKKLENRWSNKKKFLTSFSPVAWSIFINLSGCLICSSQESGSAGRLKDSCDIIRSF
jgi:hypothetical protein